MLQRFVEYLPDGQPRALALVAHGLNLHPDRMRALCEHLRAAGTGVLRMALAGHRGDYAELEQVTPEAWLQDFAEAAGRLAALRARTGMPADRPRAFVGQSLGALTFCHYLLARPDVPGPAFTAALLLSPALALRLHAMLLKPVSALTRRLPIPSASSPADRLYGALPGSAYRALYRSLRCVQHGLAQRPLETPLTAVCHPRDELVSVRGIERLITTGRLARASFELLTPDGSARGTAHLGVDPGTLGTENWRLVTGLLDGLVEGQS